MLARFSSRLLRPMFSVPLVVLVLLGAVYAARSWYTRSKAEWAMTVAIPGVVDLVLSGDLYAAFRLAEEAEKYVPDDPLLVALWPRISLEYTITTDPPGASVFFKPYSAVDEPFLLLGQSPLIDVRFPIGAFRYRVEKEGFDVLETVRGTPEAEVTRVDSIHLVLEGAGRIPEGMLAIPPGPAWAGFAGLFFGVPKADLPEYFIDKHEVTNADFKKFIDAGGYDDSSYWKQQFVRDGVVLQWDRAIAEFHDSTGVRGPSTWSHGSYASGLENHPVSGVSWYEAAAYAEFVDKSLPTIYHWAQSQGGFGSPYRFSEVIVPLSNYAGAGTAPVGIYQGIGYGEVYDLAGNVREWSWNASDSSGERRYSLGGAWNDFPHSFIVPEARSAWDRVPGNGFRTVRYPFGDATVPDTVFRPHTLGKDERTTFEPVSDRAYQELLERYYAREPGELDAVVESVDDSSPLWRRERITFDSGFGDDRMIANLFIPRGVDPPYQTIVYCPTGYALSLSSSDSIGRKAGIHDDFWDFLVLGGRAVLYPVYKGTYERQYDGGRPNIRTDPHGYTDWHVIVAHEIQRSIDYLESRSEIDLQRLAYYGVSFGAYYAPLYLALDARIKTGIVLIRGYPAGLRAPEIDPVNFAPHVHAPVLFIDGMHDFNFPEDAKLQPVFDLLGTPAELKERLLLPGGHGTYHLFAYHSRSHILEWLDQRFGPVVPGNAERWARR